MPRVKLNRGDPDRLFLGRVTAQDVMVDAPDGCIYANSTQDILGPVFTATIEDQTSGQERAKGGRSGKGKRTGTV